MSRRPGGPLTIGRPDHSCAIKGRFQMRRPLQPTMASPACVSPAWQDPHQGQAKRLDIARRHDGQALPRGDATGWRGHHRNPRSQRHQQRAGLILDDCRLYHGCYLAEPAGAFGRPGRQPHAPPEARALEFAAQRHRVRDRDPGSAARSSWAPLRAMVGPGNATRRGSTWHPAGAPPGRCRSRCSARSPNSLAISAWGVMTTSAAASASASASISQAGARKSARLGRSG